MFINTNMKGGHIFITIALILSFCNILPLQSWLDENLVWNPADYGGLVDLRLPPSAVWTPDIVLYNKYVLQNLSLLLLRLFLSLCL